MTKYYLSIKRIKKETCSNCKGTGYSEYKVSHNETRDLLCPMCKGEGTHSQIKDIDIRIPNIFFKK